MRAVRLHDVGDLRAEDVAEPEIAMADGVLVRVAAAGICGSDLHNFRTGQWMSRKPSTPGHELTGEVIAIGDAVTGLSPGDRVVGDSRFWCGACAQCRNGRPHLCEILGYVGEVCDGGFAERVILPERLLHRVDAALDPAVAAMAEPLAVALHAVRRLAPEPGEPVLIAGCGPIGGLAALLLSRAVKAGPVLVADRSDARRALVAEVTGALPVGLDANAVREATGRPLRFAIDATGSIAALNALLGALSGGGSLAMVGIFHRPLEIDPNIVVERELTLAGCSAFRDELPDAIGLLSTLEAELRRFIGDEIGLDAVPAAYRRLLEGEAPGLKTIVRPDL